MTDAPDHPTPEPPSGGGEAGLPGGLADAPQEERGDRAHPVGLAERLAAVPAGPELAALLATLLPGLDQLSLFDRVEVAAAARRTESWAHYAVARAAASVDRHPDMHTVAPEVPGRTPLRKEQVTAGALAMRLLVAPHEAEKLVREGRGYDGVLAPTGDALAAGDIDAPRARAIVTGLWDHPGEVAWAVQDVVLPIAPGRTAGQVRHDVARALVEVDGLEAIDRHARAREHRCVSRPRVLQSGMAGLWVVLPAVEAVQIDAVLDGAARAARARGDSRTLDQLRADGLCDLVLGEVVDGAAGDDVRTDGAPTDGEAVGGPGATGAGGTPDGGTGRRGVPGIRSRAPRTQVVVTVSFDTLIGADDAPSDLAGLVTLDSVQARALALGGVWRRIVTDPLSGTVLDVGRTRYRPPAALDEHVRIRDRYCTAPGCLVPAARCDLDHTKEFHEPPPGTEPGTTCDGNLGPGCRYHHRLKTEARFRVRQDTPGSFLWATPTGHLFRSSPGNGRPTVHVTGLPTPSAGGETPERPPY